MQIPCFVNVLDLTVLVKLCADVSQQLQLLRGKKHVFRLKYFLNTASLFNSVLPSYSLAYHRYCLPYNPPPPTPRTPPSLESGEDQNLSKSA